MPQLPSHYDILGLPKDATPAEIRRAYRELSRISHPDVNKRPGATTQFLNIHKAYETLSDPERRQEYDAQLEQQSGDPILTGVVYSRSRLPLLDEPQLIYAHIEITPAPKFSERSNPSLNLCLVIDRSTSMQGSRLDTVKTAGLEVIRQTTPDDVISIVTFSDRAEVLLPAERRHDRQSAEAQIRLIQASGGTEIYQGLETGFQQILRNLNRSLVNHIFLITDGHTYGDEKACLDLANRAASQGVRFTALGIGTEWNDEFLDDLTSRTGGNTFFVSKNGELRDLLQEKFSKLGQVFAERVSLRLDCSPGVAINSIFRLQPDSAQLPISENIPLGSILKPIGLHLLIEFVAQPLEQSPYRRQLANGMLSLILPFDSGKTYNLPISLSRVVGTPDEKETPPVQIMQALTHVTLYRMQERARKEVAQGKTDEASARLQRLATQLFSMNEIELAQTALMEADRIKQTHTLSANGEKTIKYATRALLLPGFIRQEGLN